MYEPNYETDYKPSYPTYSAEQDDDYYQEPNYKPSYRPSHQQTNEKHRVPAYKPKPQSYQEDHQSDYSKPSYPSHKPTYDKPGYDRPEYGRPEYDKPEYNNDYKYEHQNKYENEYNGDYNSGYDNTKPYDDKYQPVEVYRKKPRPTYPKEVILLQPGPAVKPVPYQHKPDGYNSGAVPGTPGKDYPNYSAVPETSFRCPYQSHHEEMYSDPEAGCQVSLTILSN